MIIMLAGLPGSGKSTLARLLAPRLPGAVLDKDIIRAALFQPNYVEYSQAQDDFCQEIMLTTAAYLLAKNARTHILLDGRTFSRRYQRERVFEFAKQYGASCAILECVCAESLALSRLAHAAANRSHPATNRNPDLYRQVQAAWEPIGSPKLIIDTATTTEQCVLAALLYLKTIDQS